MYLEGEEGKHKTEVTARKMCNPPLCPGGFAIDPLKAAENTGRFKESTKALPVKVHRSSEPP